MLDGFFLYPLICVALFHLGARAAISRPLWERYPIRLDNLTSCAACSGFWYGLACGLFGLATETPFLGSHAWYTVPLVGLCAIVWTPIIAAAQEKALHELTAE